MDPCVVHTRSGRYRTASRIDDSHYEFWMGIEDLFVDEILGNDERMHLLQPKVLDGRQVPVCMREKYTHWYHSEHQIVLFRGFLNSGHFHDVHYVSYVPILMEFPSPQAH